MNDFPLSKCVNLSLGSDLVRSQCPLQFSNMLAALVVDALGAFGFDARPPDELRCGGVALCFLGALASRHRPSGGERPLLAVARGKPPATAAEEGASVPAIHDGHQCGSSILRSPPI